MKNINFLPEDIQKILSSHKICGKYNEREVFYKKAVVKHFIIFAGKHLCWSLFLIKFIKKNFQYRCFPVNMAKLLRASVLYSICEQLFEYSATGTSNTVVTIT